MSAKSNWHITLGNKVVNASGIRKFTKQIWGYPKNLRMLELGPNLFQFIFGYEGEREKVYG